MGERSSASRQRLALIGIDLWVTRPGLPDAEALAMDADEPRIRLLSGSGDWVLVQRQPWRGDHGALMADIQATLGPERCRFGQWAEPGNAGVGPTELQARGVRHVLSFGPSLDPVDWPMLVESPPLADLAADPKARETFWRRLAPLLVAD
jgi:hypothetical protein